MPDLSQYDQTFQDAGQEWNVDPRLLKAVAMQESAGNPRAVSPKGAQGLMQITPETQRYLGITDPNDPTQSIYGAAKYLSEGLDKEGSPQGALLYYHGGPEWRQSFGPESRAYVPGVTAHYMALAPSGEAQPPDQPLPAGGASQGAQQGPLILGDSLASKGGLGGTGTAGAQPSAIRSQVAQAAQGGAYNGRDVVLSSGASNAPGDMTNVEGQLAALKDGGARNISLLGVGPGVESKAPGTNTWLQGLADKYGAQFVPLPTDQMSKDGVHPTAAGYKTLLAAATPRTATDATPAPASAPTGAGKAMASDDALSLLPPAPKQSKGSAAAADDADPLSMLPPAPKPSGPQQPTGPTTPEGVPTTEEEAAGGVWMPPGSTANQPIEPLKRISEAAASGWQNTPSILSPGAENYLNTQGGPIGRYITVPAAKIAGGILGAGGAISSAIGQGAYEAGNALDPRLGRDLYMLNQVAPAALAGVPGAATPPWMTPDAARAAAASRETALAPPPAAQFGKTGGPPVDINWLTRAVQEADQSNLPASAIPTAAERAATRDAATPGAAPGAVGAEVTMPGAARLTPGEVDAYRATAEGKKLLENQVVGEPDRTAYIPGSNPNLAEQEQTVNASRELKSLGVASAEASDEAKLAAQTNNEARKAYWEDTAKSPVDVQKADAAREEQAQADLKATWANKTDANAQPVLDTANAIKASPDGRRPAVRSAVDSITNELTDADGNLITDPEQLYGVRKHIGDLLSKEGQRETPLAARATDSLTKLRDSLDGVIEDAAPGFKQYLQNFRDASRPIDEMQVLQDTEPKLFRGPQSTMTYSDFQRFMKNVVDMRNAQGVNPYKSISDDTMQRLWNLRDDLRRSAGAQELARAPGSDTASNIIDAIKQYGKLGGSLAMDTAASHMFGPVAGPVISRGLRAVTAPIIAQRTARAQMGRMREMLYPSNPLTPPP
jgi:hypothetical protein